MEVQMLYDAAAVGDVATIRRLVAKGADVNVQGDAEGTRPLHLAAASGQVDAVRVLVELGADKEASAADGMRPLHSAAYQGRVKVVKALAEAGICCWWIETLHNAAWHGHAPCGSGGVGGGHWAL